MPDGRSDDQQVVEAGKDFAPVEPFAARLRRARRKARAWMRGRFKGWAPVLGYVYLGAALTFLIDESVTFGVVGLALGVPITWVCGLWVVPRSEDAYVLAISKVLHDWEVEVERAQRRHAAENREMTILILDAIPEPLSAGLRERLCSPLERKIEKAAPTREMVYARIISSYEQRVMLRATLAQIEKEEDGRASTVQAAVTTLLDARRAANREFVDALTQEQACLAKIAPPPALRGTHGALLRLFGEYRDAVAACYEAIEDQQGDVVRQSAEDVCDLWQARRDHTWNVVSKLGSI